MSNMPASSIDLLFCSQVAGWELAALTDAIATCDSPASFGNGALADCYPNEKVTAAEGAACTIDYMVDEQITGELSALPGCNPIQAGPGRAVAATDCKATTTISRPTSPHSDLTKTKSWAYYGCYTNSYSGAKSLPNGLPGVGSIEECIDQCTAKGFSLAGLEYGGECSCGNSLKPDSNGNGIPNAFCSMPCKDNQKEICGGANLLSVYQKCASGTSCVNGVGPFADGGGSYTAVANVVTPVVSTTAKTTTKPSATIKATTTKPSTTLVTKSATTSKKPVSTAPVVVKPATSASNSKSGTTTHTVTHVSTSTVIKKATITDKVVSVTVTKTKIVTKMPANVTVTKTNIVTKIPANVTVTKVKTVTSVKTIETCSAAKKRGLHHDAHAHNHRQ
jgi:hypothetical protein